MFLAAITELELETVLKNMDSNKSPRYNNFSNKIIKLSATEIAKPLTHIFNLTFENGKRQNADPRSADYLCGPGPWTTLVDHGSLLWTTREISPTEQLD
jgi:hypothetical protein